ncbi:MAG: heat-inducible transcriptional repressor HrcA [Candidatus Cloacimonetes bacterium]|jgi:heat-inducible transcriptional repressor|nr:heat-inducible transcriptional repressor HrcA [Candidatus Cloacimonadota bacterium]MDD4155301.1 heat-inducible transcriptional repressor HrcA [Candidatus Cloacimonadota bacterium]
MKNVELREQKILKSLIEEYIKTKMPVSSRILCEDHLVDVSSATVRSELFKLEQKGLIYQPHTSAGRIPTVSGYRTYLDLIKKDVTNLSYEKLDFLKTLLVNNYRDIPLSLHYIKQLLAKETDLLTFVAEPEISYDTLLKLDVFKIANDKLLFVVSLASGMDKTVVVKPDFEITEQQLKVAVRYVNEELSGLRIYDIQHKYLEEMSEKWIEDNKLLTLFLKEFYYALFELNNYFIHFDSNVEFLEQPEFDTKNLIMIFLNLMQRQDMLVNIMQKNLSGKDWHVILGEDFGNPEWSEFSMMYSKYEIFEIPGFLGVIGPSRMDYKNLIPMVRDIAKTITQTTKKGMMVLRNEKNKKG